MPHMFPQDLEAADVDVGRLRRFYRTDPIAPKVLDILAARTNDSAITLRLWSRQLLRGLCRILRQRDLEASQTLLWWRPPRELQAPPRLCLKKGRE